MSVKKIGMTVSKKISLNNGWVRFDLNIGGFVIRGCRWKPQTGAIAFPQRRTTPSGKWKKVIRANPAFLKQLRVLLASGESRTPRDRSPRTLKIKNLHFDGPEWLVFDFVVRSLTIKSTRWHPFSGSIQLPVTFFEVPGPYRGLALRKHVVMSRGPHINALREAAIKQGCRLGMVTVIEGQDGSRNVFPVLD